MFADKLAPFPRKVKGKRKFRRLRRENGGTVGYFGMWNWTFRIQ